MTRQRLAEIVAWATLRPEIVVETPGEITVFFDQRETLANWIMATRFFQG